jgi:hypothetical protein
MPDDYIIINHEFDLHFLPKVLDIPNNKRAMYDLPFGSHGLNDHRLLFEVYVFM